MNKRLIMRADDFGVSPGTNEVILVDAFDDFANNQPGIQIRNMGVEWTLQLIDVTL